MSDGPATLDGRTRGRARATSSARFDCPMSWTTSTSARTREHLTAVPRFFCGGERCPPRHDPCKCPNAIPVAIEGETTTFRSRESVQCRKFGGVARLLVRGRSSSVGVVAHPPPCCFCRRFLSCPLVLPMIQERTEMSSQIGFPRAKWTSESAD